jgi:hypothetical protein
MARPPLPIGTYGSVHTQTLPGGGHRAFTRFRDHDGVTRKVGRNGPTAAAAKNRLREHLRDRAQLGPMSGLNGDSRVRAAASLWIDSIDQLSSQGLRSPNTTQIYRLNLTNHVLPAIGDLRLREVTVPRVDRFIQTLRLHNGSATAKHARTVLSGVLGLAVRHGALPVNPVREIARIAAQPTRHLHSRPRRERTGSPGCKRIRPRHIETCRTSASGCSAPESASARRLPWPGPTSTLQPEMS